MYGIFTASLLHLVSFVSIQAGQIDCRDNLLAREQNTEQYEAEPVHTRHLLDFLFYSTTKCHWFQKHGLVATKSENSSATREGRAAVAAAFGRETKESKNYCIKTAPTSQPSPHFSLFPPTMNYELCDAVNKEEHEKAVFALITEAQSK